MNKKLELPKFLQSKTKKDLSSQKIVRIKYNESTKSKIPFVGFYKPVSKIL